GVLGGVPVRGEHPPADVPHHPPVPPHQQLERRLVMRADEPVEQFGIRDRARVHGNPADEGSKGRRGGHGWISDERDWLPGKDAQRLKTPPRKMGRFTVLPADPAAWAQSLPLTASVAKMAWRSFGRCRPSVDYQSGRRSGPMALTSVSGRRSES